MPYASNSNSDESLPSSIRYHAQKENILETIPYLSQDLQVLADELHELFDLVITPVELLELKTAIFTNVQTIPNHHENVGEQLIHWFQNHDAKDTIIAVIEQTSEDETIQLLHEMFGVEISPSEIVQVKRHIHQDFMHQSVSPSSYLIDDPRLETASDFEIEESDSCLTDTIFRRKKQLEKQYRFTREMNKIVAEQLEQEFGNHYKIHARLTALLKEENIHNVPGILLQDFAYAGMTLDDANDLVYEHKSYALNRKK